MNRPYIICHMVTSIDGKVTGAFLAQPSVVKATDLYYSLNRSIQADGFICGRVTMEGSFTGGWYPDLTGYAPQEKEDYIPSLEASRYAIAFDTKGKLGWKAGRIADPDQDPGYDGAQIVEVLSEQVDGRYLSYLREKGIPYLFAGKEAIDVALALQKLKALLGLDTLLLEGGSILDGAFLRADCVDELSLVVAPVLAEAEDGPLFSDGGLKGFSLVSAQSVGDTVVLSYKKQ